MTERKMNKPADKKGERPQPAPLPRLDSGSSEPTGWSPSEWRAKNK